MAKLPPQPVGVAPGSSYWNDWYEKLRRFVEQATTSVDWSIITGKPTTLAGYGITDAPTGAAPTVPVGLSAVAGTANTFIRSDGAPAISQSIVPTWSGKHTFTSVGVNIGGISLDNVAPQLDFVETDQAVDERAWGIRINGKTLFVRAFNDARTVVGTALSIVRGVSTAISSIVYGNTTDLTSHFFAGKLYPPQDTGTTQTASAHYAGTGVPNNANGVNGDYYFRSDTPGTANQRIYVKSGGVWVGIV
jgi:hypothetical protein